MAFALCETGAEHRRIRVEKDEGDVPRRCVAEDLTVPAPECRTRKNGASLRFPNGDVPRNLEKPWAAVLPVRAMPEAIFSRFRSEWKSSAS